MQLVQRTNRQSKIYTYLDVFQSLLESERHTTADNQSVDLVKHVLNQLDLI
jgi:hypothetical protein